MKTIKFVVSENGNAYKGNPEEKHWDIIQRFQLQKNDKENNLASVILTLFGENQSSFSVKSNPEWFDIEKYKKYFVEISSKKQTIITGGEK